MLSDKPCRGTFQTDEWREMSRLPKSLTRSKSFSSKSSRRWYQEVEITGVMSTREILIRHVGQRRFISDESYFYMLKSKNRCWILRRGGFQIQNVSLPELYGFWIVIPLSVFLYVRFLFMLLTEPFQEDEVHPCALVNSGEEGWINFDFWRRLSSLGNL